jgi:hypothetical protein
MITTLAANRNPQKKKNTDIPTSFGGTSNPNKKK